MNKQFHDLLKLAEDQNVANQRKATSLEWFRQKVKTLKRIRPYELQQDKTRFVSKPMLGHVYHFRYNPKTKADLPYYDLFPLCIPIKYTKGGITGLNLHYLPPTYRALLFQKLGDLEKNVNDQKVIAVTYQLLNEASKYRWAKPCLKRYLFSYMRTPFINIPVEEWNIVTFLPTEMFEKAKKEDVWANSLKGLI